MYNIPTPIYIFAIICTSIVVSAALVYSVRFHTSACDVKRLIILNNTLKYNNNAVQYNTVGMLYSML